MRAPLGPPSKGGRKVRKAKGQTITLPLLGAPKVVIPPAPKVKPRPAPKSQPGPYTNTQRKVVAKAKTQAPYKKAVKAARDHATIEQAVKVAHSPALIGSARLDKSIKPKKHGSLLQELEGTGKLATISNVVAAKVAPALVHLNPAGQIAELASVAGVKGPRKLMLRAAKDITNAPAQAVPSVYVPAAGVVEAAKGRPQRLNKFVKDFKQTDPIYNAVTGHPGKALDLANKHPGFAALEVYGLKGTAGRLSGRAMRSVPGAPAKLASTARAPRTFPGTDLKHEQTYSRDVLRKARQVQAEKSNVKKATKLRAKAAAEPDQHARDALLEKANKVDPYRISDAEVRRRMDARVAVNETVRRQNRTRAVSEATRAITNKGHGKVKPSAAHSLVTQNIVKGTVEDLTRYRDELVAQAGSLDGARLRQNRMLRSQIDGALKSGKDMPRVAEAARRYADEVMGPRTTKLVQRGMLAKEEANAPLTPYAARHMGARSNGEGLVAKDGSVLTADQIRAHMTARGVKEPAYVTQAPNQRGARNFYVTSARPPSVARGPRTGIATVHGTFDAHPDTLVEGAAKAQGLIDAFDGHMATIKEFAVRRPGSPRPKTFPSKTRADQIAADAYAKDGTRLRAVRIQPFGGRQSQLKELLDRASSDHIDPESAAGQKIVEALRDSVKEDATGDGPWALIPEVAADQLTQHLNKLSTGPAGKALQVMGGQFRKTVLATSPAWLTGNVVEAGARSLIARAGPLSYMTGKRAMKALDAKDPVAAQEMSARAAGGGHYAMADRTTIKRDVSQFEGNRFLHPIAKSLSAFFHTPGPKQAAGLWHRYTDWVFRAMNGDVETQVQTAMLGKTLRDSNLMTDGVTKLSRKAIDQAAEGMRNTNTQAQFAAEVERMYGKYQGFSPGTRAMIAMYTPFIAWYLNAVKFVAVVLPRDHPTITALTVATERATEEWRKQHGLDLWMKGALPGFLQGSIPTQGGGHQRFPNRFTPFGAFGDIFGTPGSAVLPQWQGVLNAFKGKDWKGQDLKDKTPSTEGLAAVSAFLEGTIPALSQTQNIRKKGLTALNPTAVVKPRGGKVTRKSPEQVQNAIDNAVTGGKADRIDRAIEKAMGGY